MTRNINVDIIMSKIQGTIDEYITEATLAVLVVHEINESDFIEALVGKVMKRLAFTKASLTRLDGEENERTPSKSTTPATSRSFVSASMVSEGSSGKANTKTTASAQSNASDDVTRDEVSPISKADSSKAKKAYNSRLHGFRDTTSTKEHYQRLDLVLDSINKSFINVPKDHKVALCLFSVEELAFKFEAKGLEMTFAIEHDLPGKDKYTASTRCAQFVLAMLE